MDLERIKDLNDKLQYLEGEADKHMMALYKDLFSGKHEMRKPSWNLAQQD